MYRTELPPGPEKLFENGVRLYFMIEMEVERSDSARGRSDSGVAEANGRGCWNSFMQP